MAVPKHIGFVLDGNRRFAKRLMMKPWKGHEWGAKKIEKVFSWCSGIGVDEMTMYCFSIQNFNRPKEEFNYLMEIFIKEFKRIREDPESAVFKNKIKVRFIGRIWKFPDELRKSMQELMEATKEHTGAIVNFAMAYGGRTEIVDATKKIMQEVQKGNVNIEDINEEFFRRYLELQTDPDMIIRTGGDRRTSNFLSFQSAYSEWFFVEKMWPEFEKEDFLQCVNEFENRERRFGK